MATISVYSSPLSTYARTILLLLEEAGAEYNLRNLDMFKGEHKSAEYLAKNPFGKVPTLEVDGELLYETAAITDYIDTIVANNKFSPSNPLSKARMRQIMAIIDNYFYPSAIMAIVIERFIASTQGGAIDEEKVKNAVAPAKTAADAIESLTVGSPYLLGNELSIADFYLIPIFTYITKTPEFDAITAQTPKLKTWWDEVNKLDSVKKVCA